MYFPLFTQVATVPSMTPRTPESTDQPMTHFMEKFFPSGLFVFELFPAENLLQA